VLCGNNVVKREDVFELKFILLGKGTIAYIINC
jgi:hypothetical protein